MNLRRFARSEPPPLLTTRCIGAASVSLFASVSPWHVATNDHSRRSRDTYREHVPQLRKLVLLYSMLLAHTDLCPYSRGTFSSSATNPTLESRRAASRAIQHGLYNREADHPSVLRRPFSPTRNSPC
ncbi:hypothetical protein HYPSUDRAFT_275282 [Hypholoma sublateritium FD-334 SS-4]|uniref:Uncharacterized protein n=1 Tax=Hypholoma sublateritium (strain FD-334 SS-4) TaxID=945553 RepID=A0A0D2Q4C3_HYPSF|nr:hypothetical protein HYPSUDRAFT_275282 [Hypholoma sublateritium FD-334 SS-4]